MIAHKIRTLDGCAKQLDARAKILRFGVKLGPVARDGEKTAEKLRTFGQNAASFASQTAIASPMTPAYTTSNLFFSIALILTCAPTVALRAAPEDSVPAAAAENYPATADEARSRARLLYEAIHGALQIMHRDFFDPDDKNRIPSASLEDVFKVMKETRGVELRWLGMNAKIMDVEHKARDDFEKAAVQAVIRGKEEFEQVENGKFRYVGAIQLHNQCLKCHVPHRTSLEDRFAGLAISMPLKGASK